MKVARRAPGPAYANLQWRKPREVWRVGASDARGIPTLAACCRGRLNACLGIDRGGDEPGRPIATDRTGVARGRLIDEAVVQDGATASMVMADREPAKQQGRTGVSPRT